MFSKKLINILLITILTATVLPLRQVGNLLFKNQLTEELSETHDSPVKKADDKFGFKQFQCCYHQLISINGPGNQSTYTPFIFSSKLPVSPAGDIHTPPPNYN